MANAGLIAAGALPVGVPEFRELDPVTGQPPTHTAGSDVIPTFSVENIRVGAGDRVTILQSPNEYKWEALVRRVEYVIAPGTPPCQIIALHRNVPGNIPIDFMAGTPGNEVSEVLKFPTGELPRGIPTTLRFGGPYTGGVMNPAAFDGGVIDELKFATFPVGNFRLVASISHTERNAIPVNNAAASLPDTIGMIRIGDELIVYRGKRLVDPPAVESPPGSGNWYDPPPYYELLAPLRGVLGTQASGHAANTTILNMAGFPVFTFTGGVTTDENRLRVEGGETPPEPFGFMRVEQGNNVVTQNVELFGYNEFSGNLPNFTLVAGDYRPATASALFRGAYGTSPQAWTRDSVITQFPVREPDYFPRWMRGAGGISSAIPPTPSPEIAFAQGCETFRHSLVSRLRWRMSDGGDASLQAAMCARLLLRFDGAPDWSTSPNPNGPLYSFEFNWGNTQGASEGPAVQSREMNIDLSRLVRREVNRIEWRLFIYFQDGAYQRDQWKGTLLFRGLTIDLDNETRIVSHEELR